MGFQSAFNQTFMSIAGGIHGVSKTLSDPKANKAKESVKEQIKSKQTGTKMTTKNTIQEVLKEATMGRISDEQINTLAKGMNKQQRRQYKENYIGDMNNGNKQQDAGNV